MFNREDFSHIPTEYEMKEYINNDLWEDFCKYMKNKYNINPKFEFSKCSWEYGWNVKFKKASKSLCTIYPRENYFTMLVVIGKKKILKKCFHYFVMRFNRFIIIQKKEIIKDGL